jgi:hypothetical protein
MDAPSHLADPRVVSLSALLDDLRQGHIQVARFQRPLVWRVEQQLDLLRSIREGLPVGSILLWVTRSHDLTCYEWIGARRLGAPNPTPGSERQYVLDGFQRLSTLYRALGEADEASPDAEDDDHGFFFDLEDDDFVTRPVDEPVDAGILPLALLRQRQKLMRWQREQQEDAWIDGAEKLFIAFDRYKLPVVPLVSDDLERATHAFERINRGGTAVSRVHIAHALSWSAEFDLLDRVTRGKEEVLAPVGWGKLEDDDVIETCALILGGKNSSPQHVAKALKENPGVLDETMRALRDTALFLSGDQIHTPGLVPYSRQISFLAAARHRTPMWSPDAEHLARAWLWLTTYDELFGTVGTKERDSELLAMLVDCVEHERLRLADWWPHSWRTLPSRLDFRTARARAFGLQLLWINPQLPDGDRIAIPARVDLEWLVASVVQIIPAQMLTSRPAFTSVGNRFLVPPAEVPRVRAALFGARFDPHASWLQSHIVLPEAANALRAGDYQRFVELREDDINRFEREAVDRYLKLAEKSPSRLDLMLEELETAERYFGPHGYVGENYFIRSWRGDTGPERPWTPAERTRCLSRLVRDRRVEQYLVRGTTAIRTTRG